MRLTGEIDRFVAQRADIPARRLAYEKAMYEGCVPKEFWFTKSSDVLHNLEAFESYVVQYRQRLKRAYIHGYSLLFLGDNGTGKTMFMCYLLGRAVARGFSIYYTTLKSLDSNIKIGFDDRATSKQLKRMLSSDFVAIDELAKEHTTKSDFLRSELEELLKSRYSDRCPTLLASNLSFGVLNSLYGPTIASVLDGLYQRVELEGGDFRHKSLGVMKSKMGYK